MIDTSQKTVKRSYSFEGKGLHTGKLSTLTVKPAPVDYGIVFHRVDMGPEAFVEALAENVSNTARSTTISKGEVKVVTVEHILSALTGLGVDNALVEINNDEVPILDGSARYYIEAISADGLEDQKVARKFIDIEEEILFTNEKTGSWIRITPSDHPSFEIEVDFDSRVLGKQQASWDYSDDFAREVAPCRTFVFFHEIEFLAKQGLVKGGDADNAIVIVEHPVTDEQVESLCNMMSLPKVGISENGYLENLTLHFPNECGRHKLLDLIGDLRLVGGWMNAKVTAFRPGHTTNTNTAKVIRKAIDN